MRRTVKAAAIAALASFPLASAGSAGASSDTHHCVPARGSSVLHSFQQSHCGKGKIHPGKGAHLLFFTAHDGHCRAASLQPTATNVALVRAATLCLVNRERSRHGERLLRWNIALVRAAQAHTMSMAFGDYFEHIGPHGETPLSRMRHDGYISSSRLGFEVGENIGWGSLWLGTPRAVVSVWMHSPGHRANILDGRFRDTGIGVSPHTNLLAHGQPGGIYTQDFGVIVG
jgi:uncharacterized protein YkwD